MPEVSPFHSLLACNCCQGDPLPIVYGKGRYPISQKKGHCRGCGAPLPQGRSSWCCNDCYKRFEPASVIIAVRKRDSNICVLCGYNYPEERKAWITSFRQEKNRNPSRYDSHKLRKPNYDHITPFSEGGLTILENMRTLCDVCHKARTAEWHRLRPKKRKLRSL